MPKEVNENKERVNQRILTTLLMTGESTIKCIISFIIVENTFTTFQIERKYQRISLWSRRLKEAYKIVLLLIMNSFSSFLYNYRDNLTTFLIERKYQLFGLENWKRYTRLCSDFD